MLKFLILFLVGLSANRVQAIGEGVLDVDMLASILTGFGDIFNSVNTSDVETPKMLGKWHQVYKAAINFDVFRTNMYCQVAYFKPNLVMGPEGFSVEEAYRVISKSGPIESYLKDVSKTGPGQFWVYPHQYFYPHQFYVIKAGPDYDNETYQYLIATDQNKLHLNVMARNPTEFFELYDREVQAYLSEERFGNPVFWNQPTPIYQGPDCVYPTEKEVFSRRILTEYLRSSRQQSGGTAPQAVNPLQSVSGIFGGFGG